MGERYECTDCDNAVLVAKYCSTMEHHYVCPDCGEEMEHGQSRQALTWDHEADTYSTVESRSQGAVTLPFLVMMDTLPWGTEAAQRALWALAEDAVMMAGFVMALFTLLLAGSLLAYLLARVTILSRQ